MLVAVGFVGVASYPIPYNDLSGRVEVQSHRGGIGLRNEESLWAFAYSLEIGADTLEMDTVFTQDGIPVIWHDHYIQETKCTGEYVGQYIANLTLAQVKTLDCSVPLLPQYPQQEIHLNTKIATLEEVLELITCYGDKGVTINLETKLDPNAPNETWPYEKYVTDLVPLLAKHGYASRTTIQSFDWRTLIGVKETFPDTVTVALLDDTTVVPDDAGAFPWLGGIDLDADFGGDWVAAAASIGAAVVSPVHGVPSNETVNTPGYVPFVTRENTQAAHERGMKMVPWTVDYEVTISKLFDDGVDAIISNYPERVFAVGRQRGLSVGRARNPSRPECLVNASG
ncbi:glycerophosphoryl diester phosphodiesterase [Patellaria atrata CBS 101060]|uniref:Glycerophosphoryl diester phosphodiesterase n=1 Tax=Patellaria atrata CBS 101060 TaxID=1346257 RepID=A0A9P4S788_9PEZI|nr:glycerophosphoryl diester phosphodiesterase [Patellaria atrata CBS 101060]